MIPTYVTIFGLVLGNTKDCITIPTYFDSTDIVQETDWVQFTDCTTALM